ncbi:hypothetical protein CLAFUW4_08622 [Fulvia fulva]|uniref:Uncharacterized protein n=1 Tax=Passalora fulva TaxID=5499 RepID=A0A9Q8LDJ8_PASFU|nr:uncharacterized protein CLAFUR5_08723 [Fulvia fulva]KAK4629286.1 hypothetical protein CLAFUR4_08625 [Fulvia fulva]KAK4629965.1 hypothetical protein CLAFUR0_08620 [Fulvia fulva]UJO15515.1 hypothetical protein CLAFUR5_08723 [Fulvia fulva]WPV13085.1 hypothetical protein CLAFUW4_08622 [Fulvia fulva]WPV27090.1 hypothetical protein CLAFUW7_08620 [Fulvia fulva]
MGNSTSKAARELEVEIQAVRQPSPFVEVLEFAIMAVENDVKRRHQEITKQEIHCLDTKETFVASMQLGLECYHHVEARAWAETQGMEAMKTLESSKADLKLLEEQLLSFRMRLCEEKAKIERRVVAVQQRHQEQKQAKEAKRQAEPYAPTNQQFFRLGYHVSADAAASAGHLGK